MVVDVMACLLQACGKKYWVLQKSRRKALPSPIAHSLAGLIVYRACGQQAKKLAHPAGVALVAVVAANLPDADFLPGLLSGDVNRFHHALTHSMGFLVASMLGTFLLTRRLRSPAKPWTTLVGFAVASHLLLDFFTVDTRSPYGIPLLWPLSNRVFLAPHPFFLDIQRSANPALFLPSLFSSHNLTAACREILFVGGVLLLIEFVRKVVTGFPRD